jgi:hypothetical protein
MMKAKTDCREMHQKLLRADYGTLVLSLGMLRLTMILVIKEYLLK